MTGIYCIENIENSKKYVGQAKDIEKRWKLHKRMLKSNSHYNDHLQRAWNRYGEHCFLFYVLELCDEKSLSEREIYYIEKLNAFESGYNMTKGGEGTLGHLHTDEYKSHMSELFKGRTFSDETLKRMSEAKKGKPQPMTPNREAGYQIVSQKLKGRPFSDKHKSNLSKSLKGRPTWNKGMKFPKESHPLYGKHLSDEAKRKIGDANRGRKRSEEQRLKCAKKVVCVETGEIFQSITDAAKSYDVTIYAISNVLRGKSNTCKNLHWQYAEGSGLS